MFLKKRRKYLKPEIIVEDFLEDDYLLAASPVDFVPEDTKPIEGEGEERGGAKGGSMFDYNGFVYDEDEFDDYE